MTCPSRDSSKHQHVEIWTDGSLRELIISRRGKERKVYVGGWAFILKWGLHEKEVYNGEYTEGERRGLDSDRMELTAVVKGLGHLKGDRTVKVFTDSQYVIDVGRQCHQRNVTGEHPIGGRLPRNWDLIQGVCYFDKRHKIDWIYVKAHAGTDMNCRADRLAKAGADLTEKKFLIYAPMERVLPWEYEEPVSLG